MKLSSLIVASLALAALITAGASAGPESVTGKCVKVVDGDTLIIECDHGRTTVSIDGIDAPELDQAWGKRVRSFLRSMVRGHDVEMVIVDSTGDTLTARVLVDGTDLSQMLVGRGLAWVTPECVDSDLVGLADRARELPCGLWLDPDAVPPWEFRAISS